MEQCAIWLYSHPSMDVMAQAMIEKFHAIHAADASSKVGWYRENGGYVV